MTETISTRYGAVEIVNHHGADYVASMQRRARSDQYELEWGGKRYEAFAGANWDSPPGWGSREWRVEQLFRVTMRAMTIRRAGNKSMAVVPRNQRAWLAAEEAIHEHRRLHGYGPKPEANPALKEPGQ